MTTMEATPNSESTDDKPAAPRLERAESGALTFFPGDGKDPTENCQVARCFPWSLPDRYVSIRDKDGNELHLFDTLDDVPDESRPVVVDELRKQEFVPKILRVHEIDDTLEIIVWKVDTDRGRVEFQVKDDEDIRVLDDESIVINDHTGMLFEIPDLGALDPASRALVEDRLG